MSGRELRVGEPDVALRAPQVDLLALQPVHGVVTPVGKHRDQPAARGARTRDDAALAAGGRRRGAGHLHPVNMRGLGQPFCPRSSPTTATGTRGVWIVFPAGLTSPHRAPVWDQCRANDCMQDEALITGGRSGKAAAKPEPADFDRPASLAALIRRLTSSPSRVNHPGVDARVHARARSRAAGGGAWALGIFLLLGAGACGPMVERPSFPARPDSVRPAGLLGPYDGKVIDSDTARPVAGALVAASWAFERGEGVPAPAGAEEVVTQTGADGRYAIPVLDRLPTGLSARVRRFTLIVYQRGYVAWRSDRRFPGREARRDFSQRGNVGRLERWQPAYTHAAHLLFMGGGAKIQEAAAWEAQQASLDLEGEGGTAAGAAPGARLVPLLDIEGLLSDDEIRGVTGYVGTFDKGKLADLPTTEFYDSRHFKAQKHPESFDVGLRVWRLGTAGAEAQYQKLAKELPTADLTDELGDASFRVRASWRGPGGRGRRRGCG